MPEVKLLRKRGALGKYWCGANNRSSVELIHVLDFSITTVKSNDRRTLRFFFLTVDSLNIEICFTFPLPYTADITRFSPRAICKDNEAL